MNAKIEHTSYTEKNGFVWRKRYQKSMLSVSIRTKEPVEAIQRSARMTLRFLELEKVQISRDEMQSALTRFRDDMIRNRKIEALSALLSDSNSVPTLQALSAQIELQEAVQEQTGHTLNNVKDEWANEVGRDWRQGTREQNILKIDRFIAWCATQRINTVEEITKQHISAYKDYLDQLLPAITTRHGYLSQVGSFMRFCSIQRDYIVKSPVDGLGYKNVKTVNKKIVVKREEYEAALQHPMYQGDKQTKWFIRILWATGMRINELCQLRKEDYREVNGVKCFSINAEDGKNVKNENAVRDIPIAQELLDMGIWEEKPVALFSTKNSSIKIENTFKAVGVHRTCHCFRYAISERLRDAGIADSIRAFVTGHAQELITDRVYINSKPLTQMKEAIDAVQ
ncbi:TPA: tyrosine-type recombinase/integrase [Enterobacter hormaechei]|nr:tyrosine-type recombinase/integrase [Enterobacter hormaechei]